MNECQSSWLICSSQMPGIDAENVIGTFFSSLAFLQPPPSALHLVPCGKPSPGTEFNGIVWETMPPPDHHIQETPVICTDLQDICLPGFHVQTHTQTCTHIHAHTFPTCLRTALPFSLLTTVGTSRMYTALVSPLVPNDGSWGGEVPSDLAS